MQLDGDSREDDCTEGRTMVNEKQSGITVFSQDAWLRIMCTAYDIVSTAYLLVLSTNGSGIRVAGMILRI